MTYTQLNQATRHKLCPKILPEYNLKGDGAGAQINSALHVQFPFAKRKVFQNKHTSRLLLGAAMWKESQNKFQTIFPKVQAFRRPDLTSLLTGISILQFQRTFSKGRSCLETKTLIVYSSIYQARGKGQPKATNSEQRDKLANCCNDKDKRIRRLGPKGVN